MSSDAHRVAAFETCLRNSRKRPRACAPLCAGLGADASSRRSSNDRCDAIRSCRGNRRGGRDTIVRLESATAPRCRRAEDQFAAHMTMQTGMAFRVLERRIRAHIRNIGAVFRQVNHCTRYGWPLVHEERACARRRWRSRSARPSSCRTMWRSSADGGDEQMFGAKQQIPPAE
jgi:hypothetical protein